MAQGSQQALEKPTLPRGVSFKLNILYKEPTRFIFGSIVLVTARSLSDLAVTNTILLKLHLVGSLYNIDL